MNTKSWVFFTWAVFAIVIAVSAYVIFNYVSDPMLRIVLGVLLVANTQATFSLAKVIRDQAEEKGNNLS